MADHDPIFHDNIKNKLFLKEGSTLTDNRFGVDVLKRTFIAQTSKIRKLAPRRGTADQWMPTLHVENLVYKEGRGLMSEVDIEFRGFLRGTAPKPRVVHGTTEETTALTVGIFTPEVELLILNTFHRTFDQLIVDDVGVTTQNPALPGIPVGFTRDQVAEGDVDVTYRAPYADYFYALKHRPRKPRFGSRLLLEETAWQITDIRPASHRGVVIARRVIRNIDFKVERAGRVYEVYERTQGFLASRTLVFHSGLIVKGAGTPETLTENRPG
jgi:hypothetical protein